MKKILIMLVFILSFGLCSCQSAQEKAIDEFLDQNKVKYIDVSDSKYMFSAIHIRIDDKKKMLELLVYLNPVEASYVETIPYEEATLKYPEMVNRKQTYLLSRDGKASIIFYITKNGRLFRTDSTYTEVTYTEENHVDYGSLESYLEQEYPKYFTGHGWE